MVWTKLADEILDHPKIARAGVIGWALHTAAIVWCNRNTTNGLLPRSAVRRLLDMAELKQEVLDLLAFDHPSAWVTRVAETLFDMHDIKSDAVASRLVACGLWETTDEGWRIHDFLDHNPSREEVEAGRLKKAVAGREGAAKRWVERPPKAPVMAPAMARAMGPAMGPAMADAIAPAIAPAMAPGMAKRWQNDAPDPDPIREEDLSCSADLSQDHNLVLTGSVLAKAKTNDAKTVFEFYSNARKVATGSKTLAKATPARLKLIRARLAEGYSVEELQAAVTGLFRSAFHMGDNDRSTKYIDVDHVFREAKQVDRLVETSGVFVERKSPAPIEPPDTPEELAEAKAKARAVFGRALPSLFGDVLNVASSRQVGRSEAIASSDGVVAVQTLASASGGDSVDPK